MTTFSLVEHMKTSILSIGFEDLDLRPPRKDGKRIADHLRDVPEPVVIIERKEITDHDLAPMDDLIDLLQGCMPKYGVTLDDLRLERWEENDRSRFKNLGNRVERKFEGYYEEANEQVGHTHDLITSPAPKGLLVVVNQAAGQMRDYLAQIVMGRLLYREKNGKPKYSHLDGFIYIQRLQERLSWDGKQITYLLALRPGRESEVLVPVVQELVKSFDPGGTPRHPMEIFGGEPSGGMSNGWGPV